MTIKQYKYKIKHSENGKGKLEKSLTEDQLIDAYNQLPDFLDRNFKEKGIAASYSNNTTIELTSDKQEQEVKTYLAGLLKTYNNHIEGLSLIIDQ
jgi:hypothetical protein